MSITTNVITFFARDEFIFFGLGYHSAGYFPVEELKTLRKIDSKLQGHPHRGTLPGLETTSGPLGEGLSQGIGIALSAKIDHKPFRTYVISGDGEMDEGNVWEALMLAGKIRLNNLTLIIDRNDIQIDGFTRRREKIRTERSHLVGIH